MKRPLKIASCVALLGVGITLVGFTGARHLLTNSFHGKFSADVSTRARLVQEKLEEAVLIVNAAASFEEATGAFDRAAFTTFTSRFITDDTGLTALSFVAAVPAGERGNFEAKARKLTGSADFLLYEGTPGVDHRPLGERSAYYPVLFTNTRVPSSLVVLGYELGSSPIRLAALEKARDTGEVSVTGSITIVGTGGKSGSIIFAPVYDVDKPLSSTAERRAALKGFVQAIFNLDDLIAAAFRATTPVGLPFELLDLSAARAEQPVYRWTARLQPVDTWKSTFVPTGIHMLMKFPFAGRDWAIDVRPNPAYLRNNYPVEHWLTLPIGLSLTVLFASYIYVVFSRREKLEALNTALESEIVRRGRVEVELRSSEEKYRIVADNTCEWEYWLDPAGIFLYCSPSAARVTGYSNAEFLEDPALLNRIILPEDVESFRQHRCEVTGAPSLITLTFRIRHRDGSIRWIDHICQPVLDADGRFAGTRGSNRDITEKKRSEEERERLIAELQKAQLSIRTLEGILPICASCKRIRNDKDDWVQVESYVSQHTNAEFTHGICPECARKLYPEFVEKAARRDPKSG